jgi:hypothetical protein
MFNINLTEEQRVQKSAVAIMAHKKWADTGGISPTLNNVATFAKT